MRWLGFREFTIAKIAVDQADIAARLNRDHVKELAADIGERGGEPAQAPVVRELPGSNELVCGRDRIAAMRVLKAKKLWAHVVDCTDDEAKGLELAENIYRRPITNRAELIAQLVALKEQQLRALTHRDERDTVPAARGSHDPIKTEARKQVSRAAGISPASVKKAEQRAARTVHDDGPRSKDEAEALALPPNFETFGLEVSKSDRAHIALLIDQLRDWDQDARNLLSVISQVSKGQLALVLSPAHVARIREKAHDLGHVIREAIPTGLCFHCKNIPALKASCSACGATGVVGMGVGNDVDPVLKLRGPDATALKGGRHVAVSTLIKPTKRIKVVDQKGNAIDPDVAALYPDPSDDVVPDFDEAAE